MHLPETGVMTQQRKQSHDNEQSRPDRIDSDAGCDLRTFICACGRIGLPGLASRDRPLGSTSATCLQCFLSGNGAADGRQQQVPLSWRTEIERLMVLPANGTRKTFGSKLPPRPATSFIPHVVAGVLQRRRPAPAGQFDRVVKFAGPALFSHGPSTNRFDRPVASVPASFSAATLRTPLAPARSGPGVP